LTGETSLYATPWAYKAQQRSERAIVGICWKNGLSLTELRSRFGFDIVVLNRGAKISTWQLFFFNRSNSGRAKEKV
jgi:hypothetical protein